MSDPIISDLSRLVLLIGGVIFVESDKASEDCISTGATVVTQPFKGLGTPP